MKRNFFSLLFVCICSISAAQSLDKSLLEKYSGGTIVGHSPKSTGIYLGTPSLIILPTGEYLASFNMMGPKSNNNIDGWSEIHLSKDKGATWERLCVLKGIHQGQLFMHKEKVYILGPNKAYGKLVIRRSTDNGRTWTTPTNAENGILFPTDNYHCTSTPVIEHNGRLWRALEDNINGGGWGKEFSAFFISAPVDADLLKASSWTQSNRLGFNSSYLNGKFGGWLEGNAVVDPDGKLVNILRVDYRENDGEKGAIIRVSNDGKTSNFTTNDFINMPGGCKKFVVKYDSISKKYWTVSNWVPQSFWGGNVERTRNTLALSSSTDLKEWTVCSILLQHPEVTQHSFSYCDWVIEGNDLLVLSRTAFDDGLGGAANCHDTNMITFHRFSNFRNLTRDDDFKFISDPSTEVGFIGSDCSLKEYEHIILNSKYVDQSDGLLNNTTPNPIVFPLPKETASKCEVVSNPENMELNRTDSTFMFVRSKNGMYSEGFWINLKEPIEKRLYMHVMVYYKNQWTRLTSRFLDAKTADPGTNNDDVVQLVGDKTLNKWIDVVVPVAVKGGKTQIGSILLLPDRDKTATAPLTTYYIDNIIFNDDPLPRSEPVNNTDCEDVNSWLSSSVTNEKPSVFIENGIMKIYAESAQTLTLKIVDLQGRILKQTQFMPPYQEIDITRLPSLFIVQFVMNDGLIFMSKQVR